MSRRKTTDVMVIGAGPVGLFAAISLARRGVKTEVADTGLWPCTHSFGLALNPQSLKLLRRAELLDKVLDSSYPVRTVGFYDEHGRQAGIRLGEGDPEDCLAVIRQDSFERLLQRELEGSGIHILWRHEASGFRTEPARIVASLQRYEQESRGYAVEHTEWVAADIVEYESAYAVGADGHSSVVRRCAGIEFPEVDEAQYFAVFEFESDYDAGHETRVVFADNTTNVLWPLPEGRVRWSFELPGHVETADQQFRGFMTVTGGDLPTRREKDRSLAGQPAPAAPLLDEAHLRDFILKRAPWFEGSIGPLAWRTIVRFEHRMAEVFGRGRLWLAGDAAHLAGPIGVQSMNSGLAEADDLADTLARILHGAAGAEALEEYGGRWTAVWRQLHGFERPLKPGPGAPPWVRRNVKRVLPCLPAHGAAIGALAAQLGLEA